MMRFLISLAGGIILPSLYGAFAFWLKAVFPGLWWTSNLRWDHTFSPPVIIWPIAFGEAFYFWLDLQDFALIFRLEVIRACAVFGPPILLYGSIIFWLLCRYSLFGKKKPEGIETPPPPPEFNFSE